MRKSRSKLWSSQGQGIRAKKFQISEDPPRSYSYLIRPADYVGFGQIWLEAVGFGRKRSDSVRFDRIWWDSVGFGGIRLDLVGFG